MHHAIKWHALKYRRCVILISGNHFVSQPVWHCIGMAWSASGDRTKVNCYDFSAHHTVQQSHFLSSQYKKSVIFIAFCLLFPIVLSLQELCCRAIVRRTSVYAIDTLPLPPSVKSHLKSYALTSSQCINTLNHPKKGSRSKTPTLPNSSSRNSCCIT